MKRTLQYQGRAHLDLERALSDLKLALLNLEKLLSDLKRALWDSGVAFGFGMGWHSPVRGASEEPGATTHFSLNQ